MANLVEPGSSILFEPNYVTAFLSAHVSFIRCAPPLGYMAPEQHDYSNDVSVSTLPFLVSRSDAEAVERSLLDAVHELAALVNDHCTQHIVANRTVTDVKPDELNSWVSDQAKTFRKKARSHCGVDCIADVELEDFIEDESFDGVWKTKDKSAYSYGIERRESMSKGLYCIVGLQHSLGIHSHFELHLTSRVDELGEVWTLMARFGYKPELSSNFEHVSVAKVSLDGENV